MTDTKKKFILAGILMWAAVVIFVLLTVRKEPAASVSPEEMKALLLKASSDPDNMKEEGAMKLKSLYHLNRDDYEAVLLWVPSSNMDAQEMLVVKVKDEEQTAAVSDAMHQRIRDLRQMFSSYGIDQMALIDSAVVDVRGPWCLYASDRNSSEIRAAFRRALR